mmetsp:Transcript_128271/g.411027  ORF Transcript_128271/g.411027 Transcript_128271/m.411027 type:complete len:291 (+) Transcript_128271:1243-2115(+)
MGAVPRRDRGKAAERHCGRRLQDGRHGGRGRGCGRGGDGPELRHHPGTHRGQVPEGNFGGLLPDQGRGEGRKSVQTDVRQKVEFGDVPHGFVAGTIEGIVEDLLLLLGRIGLQIALDAAIDRILGAQKRHLDVGDGLVFQLVLVVALDAHDFVEILQQHVLTNVRDGGVRGETKLRGLEPEGTVENGSQVALDEIVHVVGLVVGHDALNIVLEVARNTLVLGLPQGIQKSAKSSPVQQCTEDFALEAGDLVLVERSSILLVVIIVINLDVADGLVVVTDLGKILHEPRHE